MTLADIAQLEKLVSIVLIITRLIDTTLGIQRKITESNKELVGVAVDAGIQDTKDLDISKDDLVNLCESFFYKNRKPWNRVNNSKLRVLIKECILNNL